MLREQDAVATVAVKNLDSARTFYEQTLGLRKVMENDDVLTFDEVEDIVETLKGRGVRFEHYDLPNMTRQGDLHVTGTMKAAWFKDPDGNIFSLVTPPSTATRQTAGVSARSTA